jgi:predicted nuclease with TOPRIM domain
VAEPINLELLARHLQGIRAELRDMQFHAENDRRNVRSQFDNLAATHASQLGDVEAKMAARLDRIETLFGERFAHLDERVGRLEDRMEHLMKMTPRLDSLETLLGERFAHVDERVGRLEDRMEHLITLAEQLLKK